jgi:S-adenosylmethionine:tRNA ribosyltransferase-isomerase
MASLVLPARVLDVEVPADLLADAPVEAEGRRRDDVRMMVTSRSRGLVAHARAADLPTYLDPGDVLVVNTSSTLPAAVPTADGALLVHLSTDLGGGRWVIEVREPCAAGSRPHPVDRPTTLALAGDAEARLVAPHSPVGPDGARLWEADVVTPVAMADWLGWVGRPIRYGCTTTSWPLAMYQTVFAAPIPHPIGLGSAEMPSAGRPFTPELLSALVARGVVFAPITLHTGVSSLEAHEPPYAERYQVPPTTAALINAAHAGDGWTDLVITPERGLHVVDGIISGWHEPEASHLLLMEAVAGRPLLEASYDAAIERRYRWHEFGDLHLVLP